MDLKLISTDELYDELEAATTEIEKSRMEFGMLQDATQDAVKDLQKFVKPDQMETAMERYHPELKKNSAEAQARHSAASLRRQLAGIEVDRRRHKLDEELAKLYKAPIVIRP